MRAQIDTRTSHEPTIVPACESTLTILGAAIEQIYAPSWGLVIADRGDFEPPAEWDAFHHLAGLAGSSSVDLYVVGSVSFAWIVETAESLAFPAAFYDGQLFNGGVVVADLGMLEVVEPTPEAVLAALEEALGTSLVIVEDLS